MRRLIDLWRWRAAEVASERIPWPRKFKLLARPWYDVSSSGLHLCELCRRRSLFICSKWILPMYSCISKASYPSYILWIWLCKTRSLLTTKFPTTKRLKIASWNSWMCFSSPVRKKSSTTFATKTSMVPDFEYWTNNCRSPETGRSSFSKRQCGDKLPDSDGLDDSIRQLEEFPKHFGGLFPSRWGTNTDVAQQISGLKICSFDVQKAAWEG